MAERRSSLEGLVTYYTGISHPASFWCGRKVLVTGHTGFKGSWLVLWLLQLGAQLTGFALEPQTPDAPGQSLFTALGLTSRLGDGHRIGNICDPQALSAVVADCQPEVVLHLAAQPLVRQSYQDPLGTWSTNVQGSLHLLEALKHLSNPCAVVMVTTDKVYQNQDWEYGYRENDRLGGHDPYSASKAAAELAIASWRASFCGFSPHQTPYLAIATARSGNVIGGGDWADHRIVPDAIRALAAGHPIPLRNPAATRPWQHVLEPLGGYLRLAERLYTTHQSIEEQRFPHGNRFASSFNFGPSLEANRSVRELVETALQHWPGSCLDRSDPHAPHEASRLHLQIDKALHQLSWHPLWDFSCTVAHTIDWYRAVHEGASPLDCCLKDLKTYQALCTDVH